MRNLLITTFLMGFVVGAVSFYTYRTNLISPEVLSEAVVATFTPLPTETPSPTPTATPRPTVVATPPQPTPTAVVTPTPQVQAPADLEPLFAEFARLYGVDANLLKKIAECETHFNNAVSQPPYAGMYQFLESTWITYRKLMGKDLDINLRFGARESIETAAYAISLGKLHLWPACSR